MKRNEKVIVTTGVGGVRSAQRTIGNGYYALRDQGAYMGFTAPNIDYPGEQVRGFIPIELFDALFPNARAASEEGT